MVNAQDDQSDCGIAEGSTYTDNRTGINYVSDAGFIDGVVSREIVHTSNSHTLDLQFTTLTSFPENTRYCYTLRPEKGKGNRYLIRASFYYGNYDFKGQPPEFDLYLGSDHWYRIVFSTSRIIRHEIIHLTSSDYIYVCLINIGLGNPFISALELMLLESSMYATRLESLILFRRINFGTNEIVRYGDDKYDRIWYPINSTGYVQLQTSGIISVGSTTEQVPSKVMSTALTNPYPNGYISFPWNTTNTTEEFFIYLHIAETQTLQRNQTREFNIYLNYIHWYGPVSPLDHTTSTYLFRGSNSKRYNVSLIRTKNSTLHPIINAIELNYPKQLLQRQTEDQDGKFIIYLGETSKLMRFSLFRLSAEGESLTQIASSLSQLVVVDFDALACEWVVLGYVPCETGQIAKAIWTTKSTYGLKRYWQGDPCVPQPSTWIDINCSYNDSENPRIVSLNLSSTGLNGEIADALANLTMIKS
ncbi:leucine-rich repeat transmembrane protein kinase protein, partial [Tanacetum coccineum]